MSTSVAGNQRVARFREIVADVPSEFEGIIQRVADGESLREICQSMDVPYGRVFYWIASDEKRLRAYEAACVEHGRNSPR